MKNFVECYLERHEPPIKEFNAKEIVRRFQSNLPVWELPQEMIREGPSVEQYKSGVLHTHIMISMTTPPKTLSRTDLFLSFCLYLFCAFSLGLDKVFQSILTDLFSLLQLFLP